MYMSRADSPGERVFHMRLAATKQTPSPKLERHTVCAFPEHNAGLTHNAVSSPYHLPELEGGWICVLGLSFL